ncbi:hypothetical protein [Micromonospora chersina]|uniref:hypothetical protein n=1 Tax=Micromonospora chersina TaxID=47854 RepID=UPI00371D6186
MFIVHPPTQTVLDDVLAEHTCENEDGLGRFLRTWADQRCDLVHGSALRAAVVRVDPQRHLLQISGHPRRWTAGPTASWSATSSSCGPLPAGVRVSMSGQPATFLYRAVRHSILLERIPQYYRDLLGAEVTDGRRPLAELNHDDLRSAPRTANEPSGTGEVNP